MSTRDLVDALIAGDSISIENTFKDVMSSKVSDALDGYRMNVASSMFKSESEDSDEDTSEE